MTPQEKEKANELIARFLPEIQGADRYNYNLEDTNLYIAKQCAKIAVDEILKLELNDGYDRQFWEIVGSLLS